MSTLTRSDFTHFTMGHHESQRTGEMLRGPQQCCNGLQFQPTLSSRAEDAFVKLEFRVFTSLAKASTTLSVVTMMIEDSGMTIKRLDAGARAPASLLSYQTTIPSKITLVAVSDASDAQTHPSLFKVGKLTVELQVDGITVDLMLYDDEAPPVFDRIEVYHTAHSTMQMTPLC
jgi:hypothetical protein